MRSVRLDDPPQLASMWELFVADYLIPRNKKSLDRHDSKPDKGTATHNPAIDNGYFMFPGFPKRPSKGTRLRSERKELDRAIKRRSCELDPFDFSDTAVNIHRAYEFRRTFDSLRAAEPAKANSMAGRAWWPNELKHLINAVIAERRAGLTEGSSGEGSSAVGSRSERGYIKPPTRKRAADAPNSNARADGATSRSKSKRQRRRK